MTSLELLRKVSETANKEKNELTKSYFSGDKSYFKKRLSMFMFCYVPKDVYETINNLSSAYAKSLDY